MSLTPLLLTLQLIAVAVPIAAAAGIVGAWGASVLQAAGWTGHLLSRLFLLSMVISLGMPLVLHAAAWEATAGKFGWWTMTQSGARTNDYGVYGLFSGLLASGWIHGVYGASIVALATWYGAGQVSREVIEQARLDFSPIARWWMVELRIAAPWVLAASLVTAAIAASEMTVVDLYGFRTIADTFYLYNTSEPSLLQIVWTCALPLLLASGGLTWWIATRSRMPAVQSNYNHVSEKERPSIAIRFAAGALLVAVVAAVVIVPIMGLIVKIGHDVKIENDSVLAVWSATACWQRLVDAPRLFAAEYSWTLLIGAVTGLLAVSIAWPLAMLGRSRPAAERAFDVCAVLLLVIPGPIVGMTVVHAFQLPFPSFRFLYGQTIVPTVIALLVRAIPISYWVLRSGYRGIGDEVLDTARIDLAPLSRLRRVDFPMIFRHLALAFLASTLFASGDVPAMLPVIPAGVTTVGTRLFELLHSGARFQEASLAIWYVGAVVMMAMIFLRQSQTGRDSNARHPG